MTPVIVLGLFLSSFVAIGSIVGGSWYFASRGRAKSRHRLLVHASPFPVDVLDHTVDGLLSSLHEIDIDLHDDLVDALPMVEVTFKPGNFILDPWGRKVEGFAIGARLFLADNGAKDIKRTAFDHELVHVALHVGRGDPDAEHRHEAFRVL